METWEGPSEIRINNLDKTFTVMASCLVKYEVSIRLVPVNPRQSDHKKDKMPFNRNKTIFTPNSGRRWQYYKGETGLSLRNLRD